MTSERKHREELSNGAPPIEARGLARGEDWHITEFTCHAGPDDRPFEEIHEHAAIAAVVEGSFQYRSQTGNALLYPGAFLLGNAGACFECGHQHGVGDRCVAFQYSPEFFAEIAASVTGSHRFRFPAAMVPAIRDLALPRADVETMALGAGALARDEAAIHIAETVLATVSGEKCMGAAPSARDEQRISRALRHIEAHADGPLALTELAVVACMSKYHFLRTFRRIVGLTPHQYLLDLRMRRAAVRLSTTPGAVAAIAYDSGFGDLSTFNGRFRALFGVSPSAFRRRQSQLAN